MGECENRSYVWINYLKFIMALIILTYHCRPWESFQTEMTGNVASLLTALSVFFFFITSGFLLFSKIEFPCTEAGEKRLKKYLARTARLYLFWSLVYLPLAIYGEIAVYGESVPRAVIKILRGFFLLGRNYMSWQMWYLLALLVAVGIIFFLLRRGLSEKKILLLSFLFFLAGRWLDGMQMRGFPGKMAGTVARLYFAVFDSTSNGVFAGFFFISIGMYLAKHGLFRKRKRGLAAAAFLGSLSLFLYQYRFMAAMFLIGATVALFDYVIKISCRENRISILARNASRDIYLIHMLFCGIGNIFWRDGNETNLRIYLFTLSGTAAYVVVAEALRQFRQKGGKRKSNDFTGSFEKMERGKKI